eukprot:8883154-Lingulodinium_polyedra.AAC.1
MRSTTTTWHTTPWSQGTRTPQVYNVQAILRKLPALAGSDLADQWWTEDALYGIPLWGIGPSRAARERVLRFLAVAVHQLVGGLRALAPLDLAP